jgi:hypothetical protein
VISRIEIDDYRNWVGKGLQMGTVARNKIGSAMALVGLSVGLLAHTAMADEERAPVAAEFRVDMQAVRSDIDSYIRSTNERLRTTLGEQLSRELAPQIELASNELRARS